MEKEEFFKQYQTKEWYEISKRIKARDNNTCQMCGRNDIPLSVHHLYYGEDGDLFSVPESSLITLCEECHERQKEFRNDTEGLLRELRTLYTDFEVYLIISDIEEKYFPSSSDWTFKRLDEDIIPLNLRKKYLSYLQNINKWRKNTGIK